MNVKEFVSEFGSEIDSYKEYDNGVIRFKFVTSGKIMWVKRMVCENLGLRVKTRTLSSNTYWFEPVSEA